MTQPDARCRAVGSTARRLRAPAAPTAEPARPAWDNTEALLAVASLHGDGDPGDHPGGDPGGDPDEEAFCSAVARRDGTIGPGGGCRPPRPGPCGLTRERGVAGPGRTDRKGTP